MFTFKFQCAPEERNDLQKAGNEKTGDWSVSTYKCLKLGAVLRIGTGGNSRSPSTTLRAGFRLTTPKLKKALGAPFAQGDKSFIVNLSICCYGQGLEVPERWQNGSYCSMER